MATYEYDDDDIVISGIGGRFPKSDNMQELMENLFNGVDMTSDDHTKWPQGERGVPHKIGCMKDLNKFDAQFFGIIRKNCNSFDPVTRQFLERTLEALFDAGINPSDLKGTKTGVLMACAVLETEMILTHCSEQEAYGIMGRTRALNANRLSYWLDLKGPSLSIDSFYNGGIQALYEGYRMIKNGVIDAAIVGTGGTLIHSNSSYQYTKLNLLSPDGNTRSFDADADGYARSEAVSVVLLQRARDAKRCHATILNVMNRSMAGSENLYFEPSQNSWKELLERFYAECNVDPKEVFYLESDGTGIPEMDARELNAAAEVFCKDRTRENPLLIGSVKSNLGHAEGAANFCGLAKLIIALGSERIPKNLHFTNPNPEIKALIKGTMKVVTEETPLSGDLVAQNSYGFNSSYGHILLRKHPQRKEPTEFKADNLLQIALVSSRNEEGIHQVLDMVESEPFDPEYINLVNNAFHRSLPGHMYRGFTVLPIQEPHVRGSGNFSGDKRPVWFIYAGMGSQSPAIARDLMHLPVFRKSIEISAKLMNAHGVDLIHILTHDDPTLFDNILYSFVSIISVQIALTDLLRSLGIEPDGIIGHSVGETTASYADGCLTHEQTLLAAYYRGRASLETDIIPGKMAAVGVGYQEMKDKTPEGIEIACHNGQGSCTLSGPVDQVTDYVAKLQADGVFARVVNVNIPYHSKYIQKMGPIMHDYLKHVIPEGRERSSKWVSTSIPESRWGEPGAKICNAEYHINNLLNPVLFEEGCRHIPKDAITIEIAPHGLLQAILKRSLPTCVNISLTNRNTKNQQHALLKAIGSMYVNGMEPKVETMYPTVTYPVSRGTSFVSRLVSWDHSDSWSTFSDTGNTKNERVTTVNLRLDQENSILRAYKQDGVPVIPQVVYLTEIWKIYAKSLGTSLEESKVEFKDVQFYNDNQCPAKLKELSLFLSIQPAGHFEILQLIGDDETLVATGTIKLIEKPLTPVKAEFKAESESSKTEFYSDLLHNGHFYDQNLQVVSKLTIGNGISRAHVNWNRDPAKLLDAMLQVRTLQASDKSSKVKRVKKIRQLVVDLSDQSPEQVEVDLSLVPDVIRCGKIEIRDVIFESVSRNPLKFEKEELNTTETALPISTSKVDYLQFNGSETEGLQVAYVANKKIMGIGEVDEVSASVNEDSILKWEIPITWTADVAISVPLNYGLAYYVLHTIKGIKPHSWLAVTDGSNKLGLACLRVLVEYTTNIVTVVFTEDEKRKLKALLPKLSDENILVSSKSTSQHVCMKIKSRCPEGVEFLVNTGAADIIDYALKCLSSFSTIIELNDEKFKNFQGVTNAHDFLKSITLINCSGSDLYRAPNDVKEDVHQMLQNGITSGVVTPFKDAPVKEWRQTKTIKLDSNRKQVKSRYECDPAKAYLILGGDSYAWISIAEWFIQRKAKNILVVHQDVKPLNSNLQKKLKHLEEKCNMVVKTAKTFSPELINHIFEVSRSKIDLTMLIPNGPRDEPNESVVQALCQKDTFLVTVLHSESTALKYCKERNPATPTLTVLWNEPLNGRAEGFLQVFDRLLISNKNQVVQVEEDKEEKFTENDFYDGIFPSSPEQLLENYVESVDLQITEIRTLSVGYESSKEVTPFFVFPGLTNRTALVNRFRESLYPVIIVDLPVMNSASVSEYAACAVPRIKALIANKKGPFTLLGENWGGAVALEVAAMLEKTGEKTHVILIGGSSAEVASHKMTSTTDDALLTRVFGHNPELNEKLSWNERLSVHLSTCSPENESLLKQALTIIRDRTNAFLTSKPKEPINGSVVVVSRQNIPQGKIRWMSRQGPQLMVVAKSEPLLNNEVFEFIHESVPIKLI